MRINVHPDNPPRRKLEQVADIIRGGGTMIYPTDTVYALGCGIGNHKAVDKICRLRGLNPAKANLSIICNDLSQLSDYAAQLDNHIFRELKRMLPGPYTIILKGNGSLPKIFKNKKKTIGIRIPDNEVTSMLVDLLGEPILTASLKWDDDDEIEYPTDIDDIYDHYGKQVDVIIDAGAGGNMPSTVLDATSGQLELVREGKGDWE
ncbi:MAG: L-threonylcarbamoyladenylate synthase [Saprospiraceae bacterium]